MSDLKVFISHTSDLAISPDGAPSFLGTAIGTIAAMDGFSVEEQSTTFAAEDQTSAETSRRRLAGCGVYLDIVGFERYLSRNGIAVCKFFLHLSKKEQKRRFLARLDNHDKNWKFSTADLKERKYWDEYQDAYEKMIRSTATEYAPWVIVPADNKWFSRLLVVATIVATLDKLNLEYPKVSASEKAELKEARKHLEKE